MAGEIFDDVAFFFFVTSLLAIVVVPWTLYYVIYYGSALIFGSKRPNGHVKSCNCVECKEEDKMEQLRAKQEGYKRYINATSVIFVVLWIGFAYCLAQLPSMSDQTLVTFDPVAILELDPDRELTEAYVRKQYRTLTLRWHPDKNPDNPEAANMFMMVHKAYQVLSDPDAMRNLEETGSVDGNRGGVTLGVVGLPNWMANPKNAMTLLVSYVGIFIVLVPLFVCFWWRSAKFKSEAGVDSRSIDMYKFLLKENAKIEGILVMAVSGFEFRHLFEKLTPNQKKALVNLGKSVRRDNIEAHKKEAKKKTPTQGNTLSKWQDLLSHEEIILRRALVLAHLQHSQPVPPELRGEFETLYRALPGLLNVMLDICFEKNRYGYSIKQATMQGADFPPNTQRFDPRGMFSSFLQVVSVLQYVTQGLFEEDSPFMQLPHFDMLEYKDGGLHLRNKKRPISFDDFLNMSPDERSQQLGLFTVGTGELREAFEVADRLPRVELDVQVGVDEEKDIFQGDILSITVSVDRTPNGEYVQKRREAPLLPPASTPVAAAPAAAVPAADEAKEPSDEAKEPATDEQKEEEGDSDSDLDDDARIERLLDVQPESPEEKQRKARSGTAPLSLAYRNPFPRQEQWFLVVVQTGFIPASPQSLLRPAVASPGAASAVAKRNSVHPNAVSWASAAAHKDYQERYLMIDFRRVTSLTGHEDFKIRMPVDEIGQHFYEVHLLSENYVGLDAVTQFAYTVLPQPGEPLVEQSRSQKKKQLRAAKAKEANAENEEDDNEDEDNEDDEEEEEDDKDKELPTYWYYLGGSTFFEGVMNLLVLVGLAFAAYMWLQSKGHWQRYVSPVLTSTAKTLTPAWTAVEPVLGPVVHPSLWAAGAVYRYLADVLTRPPPIPQKQEKERGSGWRARRRRNSEAAESETSAPAEPQPQQSEEPSPVADGW